MSFKIWVDADACPKPAKELLFRTATKRRIDLTLVANHHLSVPKSPYIRSMQVAGGFDVADQEIADRVSPGDLVVTADVPLADQIVGLGAIALNPRGTLYTRENIKEHLARRNLFAELRDNGLHQSSQSTYGARELQMFANALDRSVTRGLRG